jgi:hypothetical protein
MPWVELPILTLEQRAQLQVWITGLDDWISVYGDLPESNVARVEQNGLTDKEEQTAQREMWQYLLDNDGQRVHTRNFGSNWVTVFLLIRESYNNAFEHEYNIQSGNPGAGQMRRSTMRDLCDEIVTRSGGQSNRPVLKTPGSRAPGQGR